MSFIFFMRMILVDFFQPQYIIMQLGTLPCLKPLNVCCIVKLLFLLFEIPVVVCLKLQL